MPDALLASPRRRRGRSVRTRVALAAGRGLEAAFVTAYGSPTRCCACPARRAHNICPESLQQRWPSAVKTFRA
jgi:hypothetical protein